MFGIELHEPITNDHRDTKVIKKFYHIETVHGLRVRKYANNDELWHGIVELWCASFFIYLCFLENG